jgi:anti-sigma factor RsiW
MKIDPQTERLLNAYLDGELGPEEAAGVEHLLDGDAAAREYFESLRSLRRKIDRAHVRPPGTQPSWASVARRLESGNPPAGSASRLLYSFSTGAVALILMGLIFWMPPSADPPVQGPRPIEEWSGVVEMVETDLENATPVVYLDEPSGWTVVWILQNPGNGEG